MTYPFDIARKAEVTLPTMRKVHSMVGEVPFSPFGRQGALASAKTDSPAPKTVNWPN